MYIATLNTETRTCSFHQSAGIIDELIQDCADEGLPTYFLQIVLNDVTFSAFRDSESE